MKRSISLSLSCALFSLSLFERVLRIQVHIVRVSPGKKKKKKTLPYNIFEIRISHFVVPEKEEEEEPRARAHRKKKDDETKSLFRALEALGALPRVCFFSRRVFCTVSSRGRARTRANERPRFFFLLFFTFGV